MPTPCPDDNVLAALADGRIAAAARRETEAHLAACESCRELIGQLAALSLIRSPATATATAAPLSESAAAVATAPAVATDELGPLTQVGHYLLVRPLGAGGMGEVHEAYDSKLDRKVALKFLRRAGDDDAEELAREARALARLAHPHVVAVHEVGRWQGRDYVAMELVAGTTVARWIETRRTWREVLALFLPVADALAVAHRAGLVHRDVKPSNLLLGDDGRVRVGDFGLARDLRAAGGERAAISGTPAYMSPEQHRGEAAGAPSDQFSYCVALWEALYGERPFSGTRAADYAEATAAGRLRAPPPGRRVPAALQRALVRGLAADPARRHPSMDALAAALRAVVRGRRRLALGAALVAACAGGAALAFAGAGARATAPAADPCGGDEPALAGTWDDDRRAALVAALADPARPHTADTAARAAAALDAWATTWRATYRSVCRATAVHADQSPALLDHRMACLTRRRGEATALITLLGEPRGAATGTSAGAKRVDADRAVDAVAALPSPAACRELRFDERAPAPPADGDVRARIEGLKARVDRVEALTAAGRAAEALAEARAIETEVAAIGFAPLSAVARHALAGAAERAGEDRAAEAALRAALGDAAAAHDDELSARILARLLFVVGARRAELERAETLAPIAEAAVVRAGDPPLVRAMLLDQQGSVWQVAGRYRDAAGAFERAAGLRAAELGPDHALVARTRVRLCSARRAAGELAAARAACDTAVAALTRALGPRHPDVGAALVDLGSLLHEQGDFAAGDEQMRRGVALLEAAYGAAHRTVAIALGNLAGSLEHQGKIAEALPVARRALALREQALGADHPQTLSARASLGYLLLEHGDPEAADQLTRALADQRRVLPPRHPDLAMTLTNLGDLHARARRYPAAAALYRESLAISEAALGDRHPDLVYPLALLGETELERGRAAAALPLLERAAALADVAPLAAAEVRFLLARALWQTGRDRPRARALAADAHDRFARDPEGKENAAAVARWLAPRGGRK